MRREPVRVRGGRAARCGPRAWGGERPPARGDESDGTAGDAGSATVWVLACCVLVLVIATLAVLRTAAVLARHRAESAADLSALAAAGGIGTAEDPCGAARRVAAANHATVSRCSLDLDASARSGTVLVQVGVTTALPIAGSRTVLASARAGRLPA